LAAADDYAKQNDPKRYSRLQRTAAFRNADGSRRSDWMAIVEHWVFWLDKLSGLSVNSVDVHLLVRPQCPAHAGSPSCVED
jgi:hypothetical protein